METEYLFWNLKLNDSFTTALTGQVVSVALAVAVICFILSVAWNYLKSGFDSLTSDNHSKFPDIEEMARGFVIIVLIASYLPIIQTIVGGLDTINHATAVNSSFSKKYEEVADNFNQYQNTGIDNITDQAIEEESQKTDNPGIKKLEDDSKNQEDDETGFMSTMASTLQKIALILDPQVFVSLCLHSLFILLFQLVKLIVLGVAVLMVKVLIILGPLAFAFSILPMFRKQLEVWFGSLVNTAMVFTTINILDAIVGSTFVHILNPNKDLGQHDQLLGEVLALNIVMLIMYASSFLLTSKIVGKGDAGRVLSKLVSTSTALVGMAMVGGGAAAGESSNISNVALVGKNAIDDGKSDEK